MGIQELINYSVNQKMKNKDTDCWGVFQFQSFRVKGGTKAQRKIKRSFRVSEFKSFKVKKGTEVLRH